jgi:hypothetical protein
VTVESKITNIFFRFYPVLSCAISSIPTILCDTKSWQAIWSDPDRSGCRSLKCRDDFQAVNQTPPTTTITNNEPPSKRQRRVSPVHIEPPKMFKDALHMILASWKMMTYLKLKIQLEQIAFFPNEKGPFVTTNHM